MKRFTLSNLLVLLTLSGTCAAATITVDPSGGGDFCEIQPAIDAAQDSDTVLVRAGEYVITESIDFNRLHDPEDLESPPVKNIVLRSETGAEETLIRSVGLMYGSVVIFENGEIERSVIEGFTLTGGESCGITGFSDAGGGVYCVFGSSPTITNCTIVGNAADAGGGVSCVDSSPTITDCTITGNWAWHGGSGGGVCCLLSSPKLTNCTISGNVADKAGGGMFCCESSPIFTDCTFTANSAGWRGGGIDSSSSATFANCTITANTANLGGGVSCGAWLWDWEHWGCGRWPAPPPTFTNCTIAGNWADSGGGVYFYGESSPKLQNCIVWGNRGGSFGNAGTSNPIVSYSCLETEVVWPGEGNINQDPIFVQAGHWNDNGTPDDSSDDTWVEGDYHLQPGSPCIDAGTSEGAPTTDIEGHGRPCGAGVEIGAYEFGDCPGPKPFVRGNVDGLGGIDISDVLFLLTFLFLGGGTPDCLDAGDVNDDGRLNLTDAINSLTFQFLGGSPPNSPYPECGTKEWINGLTCESFPPCL